jgi:hypothetical protein
LLDAISLNRTEQVNAMLQLDPAAANYQLWQPHVEPPLCCAVRVNCEATTVDLLIGAGADVNDVGNIGMSPLALLSSMPCFEGDLGPQLILHGLALPGGESSEDKQRRTLAIATSLCNARADPMAFDTAGRQPLELAREAGNHHFVELWRDWLEPLGQADLSSLPPTNQMPSLRAIDLWSFQGVTQAQMSTLTLPTLEMAGFETPPVTPRKRSSVGERSPPGAPQKVAKLSVFETPPVTPRDLTSVFAHSPPGAPRPALRPELLDAICTKSTEQVHAILQADPKATDYQHSHPHADPPLCCAVRHGCEAAAVQLLLSKDADVNIMDSNGMSPLVLLSSMPSFESDLGGPLTTLHGLALPAGESAEEKQRRTLAIATSLCAARADPYACDAAGRRPLELARETGNRHLVQLWQMDQLPSQI